MSTTTSAVFQDRAEAGRRLAARVQGLRSEAPVVLGIPAGGMIVAAEVAQALGAPIDVLVVRKLGQPGARFGALAEGGVAIVRHERARASGVGAEEVSLLRTNAEDAADRLARRLRRNRAPHGVVGRTVLLVDDGVGTGDTALAAARTLRRRGAARIVLVVPIAGAAALHRLDGVFDDIICEEVASSARWYERAARPTERELMATLGRPRRDGRLYLPEGARGAIVLAGTEGFVLRHLHDMNFATLVVPGDATGEDVAAAVDQLKHQPETASLAAGVLGFGEAAEAALVAASADGVAAAVVAGGRPDQVAAPLGTTLLVVGGEDRQALARARATGLPLAVVPGAGPGFAEPGALEQVAHLAGGWYVQHL